MRGTMTGIVAIVADNHAGTVSDAEVAAFADTYDSLRGQRTRHAVGAGDRVRVIVLGSVDREPPEIERRDSSWAATIGVVHYRGPLIGARPEDLGGHFGLVAYDAENQIVLVATDPLSFQPLYTAQRDAKTYVCDSALALAKYLRARPSSLGILTFLRTGYHFGTMTHWEGVNRMDPGSFIRFTAEGRRTGSYWRPEVDREVTRLRFAEAVEHVTNVALETCEEWVGGSAGTWADLTGGYDSRLLALLLERVGVRFDANTRGDYTGDRVIAGKIARLKGWRWLDLVPPPEWSTTLPEMLPGTVAWSDGHLDPFELSWVLWAHSRMSKTHPSVLYAGGGEHLRGYTWRQEFPRAGKTTRVNWDNWVDLRLINPVNLTVFAEDPTPEVRADMLARMRSWVEPYASELNTTQCDLLFVYKMTGHFGIYRSADAAFINAQVPLYSKEMFTAAISTDYRHRRNHRLVRHMIWRLDPRTAAIETDSGGPAEPWRLRNLHRFVPYYTQLVRKGVNKVGQKFLDRKLVKPVESGSWWCPPDARRSILDSQNGDEPFTYETMRSAGVFDRRRLEEFLERARRENFTDTGMLGRIAAVELSLRAADASLEGR